MNERLYLSAKGYLGLKSTNWGHLLLHYHSAHRLLLGLIADWASFISKHGP